MQFFTNCNLVTHSEFNIILNSYRRPPVHVFPAAIDDTLESVTHIMDNADMYGIDVKRIAIMGTHRLNAN